MLFLLLLKFNHHISSKGGHSFLPKSLPTCLSSERENGGLNFLSPILRAISTFLQKFNKLTIARGNFVCGEFTRALQYLELHMEANADDMAEQLPFLAEIYALLDEPDSVAGEKKIRHLLHLKEKLDFLTVSKLAVR